MRLIGCNIPELKEYLESFWEPWMNWNNHGQYNPNQRTWQIDHIIPCEAFDLTREEEQLKCFHYSNLRPICSEQNRVKHDFLENGMRARDIPRLFKSPAGLTEVIDELNYIS